MTRVPARRLHWSRLTLPILVLLIGIIAFGFRWATPTLPFASGRDLRQVGQLFHPHLPLQTGDEILQINGRSPDEWTQSGLAALQFLEPSYQITIDRDGDISTVTVRAEHVPLHLGMLWWSSALALGLTALLASALIGMFGGNSPAEHGIRMTFLGLALYLLCVIPLIGAPPLSWVFEPLLIPVQIVGVGLTSGVVVFSSSYLQPVPIRHARLFPLGIYGASILTTAILVVFLAPDSQLERASIVTGKVVNALIATHALIAIILGVRAYQRSKDPLIRAQFRWMLWGGIVGVLPWLTLWSLPIVIFNNPLVPFVAFVMLPALAIPFSFMFAILRYRLLDVDRVLSRTIIYLALGLTLVVVYALLTAVLSRVGPTVLDIDNNLRAFLATLVMVVMFIPALRLTKAAVERLFYHERQLLLHQIDILIRELRDVEHWETLLPLLNERIPQRLGVSHAQILLWNDGQFILPDHLGSPAAQTSHAVTIPALRVILPPDWPLDRPLILQDWTLHPVDIDSSSNGVFHYRYIEAPPPWARALCDAEFHLAFILVTGGQPIGLYALGRHQSGDWYEHTMITALGKLADRIAGAVKIAQLLEQTATQARLRHELTIAQQIQQRLLPQNYACHERLEVAACTLSASEVGGDMYSIHPQEDGGLIAAVGDASGKGISAALLMAITTTMLNTVVTMGITPSQMLAHMNQLLRDYTAYDNQNVALCYFQLCVDNGDVYQLQAASAGAIPILICRITGKREWLYLEGPPLGTTIEDPDYAPILTTVYPGDKLVICTDGITEARTPDGVLLSFGGVERILADAPMTMGAQTVMQHLLAATRQYTQQPDLDDDITLMVICCQ